MVTVVSVVGLKRNVHHPKGTASARPPQKAADPRRPFWPGDSVNSAVMAGRSMPMVFEIE